MPDWPGPLDFPFILPQRPGTDINPTIDIEDLAGDPAGFVAGEIEGRVSNIFGATSAGQTGDRFDRTLG